MRSKGGREMSERLKPCPHCAGTGMVKVPDDNDIRIEDPDLSIKAYNVLKRNSINTLGDLAEYTEYQLLKMKHWAAAQVTEVIEQAKKQGVTILPYPDYADDIDETED
jgi:DNA-directed RNA polymerase subunit alpha